MKEKINHLVDAFVWRFLNIMKVSFLPAVLGILLIELERAGDLSCLADPATWEKMVYAGLVAVLTSILAGLDKVQRENIRLAE